MHSDFDIAQLLLLISILSTIISLFVVRLKAVPNVRGRVRLLIRRQVRLLIRN